MRLGFVRRNFIGHHGWNGRESTNQLQQHISHIETLYFLFYRLLVHNLTIYPGFYPVLVILNISPTSPQTGRAFLCFSHPPGCAKDHVYVHGWPKTIGWQVWLFCQFFFLLLLQLLGTNTRKCATYVLHVYDIFNTCVVFLCITYIIHTHVIQMSHTCNKGV